MRKYTYFENIFIKQINFIPGVRNALSAAPSASERPPVQFRVKTGGPPPGQSVLVHLGQQHAAFKHRTLAQTALFHYSP